MSFPLGVFTAVTGVSGSGKSSLVNDILYKVLANELNGARQIPGRHTRVTGLELLDKVVHVDQAPIGRTPRSNPATYTGVFDRIRTLFSETAEAKARGYLPGRFSFNVKGGRCENCAGDGTITIEMNFLPDVYVVCEVCGGARYNRDTLAVHYKGKNIAQVLDMPIAEAADFFEAISSIHRYPQDTRRGRPRLRPARTECHDAVGRRGAARQAGDRAAAAGDRQERLRARRADHGAALRGCPQAPARAERPRRQGQHRHRDRAQPRRHQVGRLGSSISAPEGGAGGGELIAVGTPEEVAESPGSHTAIFLREILAQQQPSSERPTVARVSSIDGGVAGGTGASVPTKRRGGSSAVATKSAAGAK